jgi:hypothetical protein
MAANPREDDLHGIPMGEEEFERLVDGETSYRYELIDGLLYNMTGSSPERGVLVTLGASSRDLCLILICYLSWLIIFSQFVTMSLGIASEEDNRDYE